MPDTNKLLVSLNIRAILLSDFLPEPDDGPWNCDCRSSPLLPLHHLRHPHGDAQGVCGGVHPRLHQPLSRHHQPLPPHPPYPWRPQVGRRSSQVFQIEDGTKHVEILDERIVNLLVFCRVFKHLGDVSQKVNK